MAKLYLDLSSVNLKNKAKNLFHILGKGVGRESEREYQPNKNSVLAPWMGRTMKNESR